MGFSNEEYGRVIRQYRGRGKLELTNGNELPCYITIQQVESGLIYITCNLSSKVAQDSSALQFLMDFSSQNIENVHGKTKDGMYFKSQEQLLLIHSAINLFSSKSSKLRLVAQLVEFWPENRGHAKRYKFSVVNFEFTGNNIVKRVTQDGPNQVEQLYRNLVLKTHWGIAAVTPVPDYDSVIRMVKAQKGISVTCEIDAKPSVKMDTKKLTSKMDELCRLLSLSRGTKINWINTEEYTRDGKTCGIILRNAVTWPFSSLPLIDPREPSDTPLFIEKVYPAYLKLRDGYNLDVAFEQCLDAKRETAYLTTRALAAVALIDSLQQQYASRQGLTEIVKGFGKQKNKVREYLKNFITSTFTSIKTEELDEMMGKIPELNRRSFLNLLKKWTDGLGLQISLSELSAIRSTRNCLAHKMCFKSSNNQDKIREYFRLINFINQVFLKLLDYKGYYIHFDLKTMASERRELA